MENHFVLVSFEAFMEFFVATQLFIAVSVTLGVRNRSTDQVGYKTLIPWLLGI